MGGKRIGQKVLSGGQYIGNKIWENKGKLLMMGTALAGLHGVDKIMDSDVMEKVQTAREGLANIPMENVGEREGYMEQVKDAVFKEPLEKRGYGESYADMATKLLFKGVPKRHSAELKILERAGLDAFGKPKRPEPSWN